jgi:hypothetical protein
VIVAVKIIFSAVSLLIGLLVLYSSAYAFGVNTTLISILRVVVIALTLLAIGLSWKNQWAGSLGSIGGVVLMLGLISLFSH